MTQSDDVNFESEFQKIIDFNCSTNTQYWNADGSVHTYYAVLLNNGKVDTTTFENGRIWTDRLTANQNFITIKRIRDKDNVPTVIIREVIPNDRLYDVNLDLYEYIKAKCQQ